MPSSRSPERFRRTSQRQGLASQARKHLKEAMKIVRNRLLPEWLEAQEKMLQEATAAAKAKGWYVEKDEKQIEERLLGTYKAPSLLIRTWDREMRLMPVARFCAGRQGVVDLKVSPTYERAYMVTFKDGRWQIVSLQGRQHKRPFNRETFGKTISQIHPILMRREHCYRRINHVVLGYRTVLQTVEVLIQFAKNEPKYLHANKLELSALQALTEELHDVYFVRVFACFESDLRHYWRTSVRDTKPPTEQLLSSIARTVRYTAE